MSDTINEITLNTDTTKSNMALSIVSRVLSIWRIGLSLLFSSLCVFLLVLIGKDNEAGVVLSLFFLCFSALFLYLFIYVLRIRPIIIKEIKKESEQSLRVVFKTDKLNICGREIGYKNVKGQYWFDDGYFVFIDSKAYKSVLCFGISKDSFDEIGMLSSALERNKIRLVQIKKRRNG